MATGLKDNVYSCCLPCTENDRNTRARHYCVDCEMYFCKQCVQCHNTIPSLRKHQLNDVNCSDSDSVDDETLARGSESVHIMRCNIHQGKVIDTYCEDHDEIICGLCVVVKHRPCKTKSIAVAAKDFKSNLEVSKSKEEFTKLLVQLKQEQEKRAENLDHIEKQKLALIKNVDSYEEQIIAKVKTLADSSRKEIRSKFDEHKVALDNDVVALNAVITNAELHANKLELIDDELLFGNVKMSKSITKDVETLLQDMATDWRKKEIQFNFDKTLENLVEGMKLFGQLEEDYLFEDDSTVIEYGAKLHKNVSVKLSTESQENHVVDMCMLDSGDLLLLDINNRKLKRYNTDLQFMDEICISGQPIAVCKIDKVEVAVRIYSTKVVHIVSIAQSMQLTSSFTLADNGRGMTYDVSTEEIYACEEDKVSVYSKTGAKLRTYCTNTNGEQMFSACRQIALSEKSQNIYVTDQTKGLIVMDRNGSSSSCLTVDVNGAWPLCILPCHVCLVGGLSDGTFVQIDSERNQVGKIIDGIGQTYTNCVLYDRVHARLIIGGFQNVYVYTLSKLRV